MGLRIANTLCERLCVCILHTHTSITDCNRSRCNLNCPGFQCPTVEQDAEQNALLKAILFTPWSCTNPMTCGNVITYKSLLSNGTHQDANLASAGSGGAPQPACSHTFKRAWKLRSAEIHVLADRALCRCMAARKRLVLADTTLFLWI